ncbi:MAG TPA: VOC family protein [Acidimicrobiales bacterium]|nr:VOC family protein [Acidimicrobiales bacterium]
MSFHAYLFFGGDCRAAFTRYQEVFGGDLEVLTMADAPDGEGMPGASPDTVLHAALTVGDGLLMGSDDPTTDDPGPVQGVMVSYSAADADEARRVFDALSEGGQVTQELIGTFFSPAFGMCTDRFGTPWMVSAEPATEG